MPPAVILAGGKSRRFGGGDKCLLPLAGKPLLTWITERLAAQVGAMALSANGDANRFADFNGPVLPDPFKGHQGPLAGICAGLAWADGDEQSEWLLVVSGDTPFIPRDLVAILYEAANTHKSKKLVAPKFGGQVQPLCGLWHKTQSVALRDAVEKKGCRSIRSWIGQGDMGEVDYWEQQKNTMDPFFNINTPEDLALAETYAESLRR